MNKEVNEVRNIVNELQEEIFLSNQDDLSTIIEILQDENQKTSKINLVRSINKYIKDVISSNFQYSGHVRILPDNIATTCNFLLSRNRKLLFLMDEKGKILEHNKYVQEFIGSDTQNFAGRVITDLIPPSKTRGILIDEIISKIKYGGVVELDLTETGIINSVELALFPIILDNRSACFAIGFDISEKINLEKQLFQAQKMEIAGRLTSGIAHDLNNILTVITGYTDLLDLHLKEKEQLRRYISEIRKASNRAVSLNNQLLAFSRKKEIDKQVIDINEVISDMKNMITRLIGEDINCLFIQEPNLDKVIIDPWQFQQIMMNLAINSRDAMPDGGNLVIETSNISFSHEFPNPRKNIAPGSYVMLVVSDTGCGIPEKHQQMIFEPFFTTKKIGEGTGLGLSTVINIIKKNNGYVYLISKIGKGTSFKIYLPSVKSKTKNIHEQMELDNIKNNETVLVVEDDHEVGNLLHEILNQCGYDVTLVRDGQEALHLLEKESRNIDILITDVFLPGMKGIELYQRCIKLRPQIKVLYISGYSELIIRSYGELDNGALLLQKPFSRQALFKKLQTILQR